MGKLYGTISLEKLTPYKKFNKWLETRTDIFTDNLGDLVSIKDDNIHLWCIDYDRLIKNYHHMCEIILEQLNAKHKELSDEGVKRTDLSGFTIEGILKLVKPIFIQFYPNYFTKAPIHEISFNEMLNFCYLEYSTTNKKYNNLSEYFIAQFQPEYGKIKKINAIKYFERFSIKQRIYILNYLHIDPKWSRSAELTAEEIRKSRIFNSNIKYSFYSQSDREYRVIFNSTLDKMKKSNNKILGDYVKTLLVDKYFISDAIAVKDEVLANLQSIANSLTINSTADDFQNLFNAMDFYFSNRTFIPISFKQIEDISKTKDNIAEVENIVGRKTAILNPPPAMRNYENIDTLDLLVYEMLADLASGGNIENYLNKNLFINYSSFKYDVSIDEFTYGGSSYSNKKKLFFIFEVKKKDKSKKYTFSVDKYVKIRALGSASATGEGTINMQSINFILNQVYSGQYTSELKKLANNRIKILEEKLKSFSVNNIKNEDAKKIINDYKKVFGEPALLNPSSRAKYLNLIDEFGIIYKNDDPDLATVKLACSEAFMTYIKSLQSSVYGSIKKDIKLVEGRKYIEDLKKIKLKYAKSEKEKAKINSKYNTEVKSVINDSRLADAFVSELGLLIDKGKELNIEVLGKEKVKIELSETKKKKIILSAWSLLSGRGAIVFEDDLFKNAKEIKDIMYTKIKLPALLKIGI